MNAFLKVYFVDLTEIRPDGSIASQYQLDNQIYLIPNIILGVNATQNDSVSIQFGYYSASKGFFLTITETYSAVSFTRSIGGGFSITIQPQTLKVSMIISNWQFEGGSATVNKLQLRVQTVTGDLINAQQTTNSSIVGGFQSTTTNYSTGTTTGKVSFLNVAEYVQSGSGGTLGFVDVQELINEGNGTESTFAIIFQEYFSKLLYDPDFGVLLSPQGTSSSAVSDTGSSNNLGLIIGLSVGLPAASLIVLVVIVVGALLFAIQRKRTRDKMLGSIARASVQLD